MTTVTGQLEIARGDDYLSADGRALPFGSTDWPDLTDASIKFSVLDVLTGARPINAAAGVVVTPTGSAAVEIPLTSAQTFELVVGRRYLFDVVATLADGSRMTLANGKLCVGQNATP